MLFRDAERSSGRIPPVVDRAARRRADRRDGDPRRARARPEVAGASRSASRAAARGGSVHRAGGPRRAGTHHRSSFALRVRPQPRRRRRGLSHARAELGPGRVDARRAEPGLVRALAGHPRRLLCDAGAAARRCRRRPPALRAARRPQLQPPPRRAEGAPTPRGKRPTSTSAPFRCRASIGPSWSTR